LLRVLAVLLALVALPGCGRPEPEPGPAAPPPEAAGAPADPSQGKWRTARGALPAGTSPEEAAGLRAIPYLQGYRPAEDRPIVVEHAPAAAYQGLNLYVSGHAAEAVLMDMKGRVLHRWRYPLRRLWPDLAADPGMARLEYWRRVHLYPNGDLLGIYEGEGMVKLDARSGVLWAHRGGIHHDLSVTDDGRIWVLDRKGRVIPWLDPSRPVLEDLVTVLDSRGRVVKTISLPESFRRSSYASLLGRTPKGDRDVFHTNTLEVLDGRFASRSPAFRSGNVLVSVLKLDALAILDPDRERVVWARTGLWRRQHQPTFLANGNLLLFDNLGAAPDRSRILELDPLSGEIAWRYGGTREVDFFSKTLGSCQRLPNGNTLITESENGRAVEVTPAGRVVWEFHNPHRAGDRGELVAVLFEMVRLPPDFAFPGNS
jgi:Arylsulfotransferase (ASST)